MRVTLALNELKQFSYQISESLSLHENLGFGKTEVTDFKYDNSFSNSSRKSPNYGNFGLKI